MQEDALNVMLWNMFSSLSEPTEWRGGLTFTAHSNQLNKNYGQFLNL